MILFKAKYRSRILDGSKTTTIRNWKRRLAKPGSIHGTNLGIRLNIHDVRDVALGALTDSHAQADGFADRAALLDALNESYPNGLPETLTLVSFSVAP